MESRKEGFARGCLDGVFSCPLASCGFVAAAVGFVDMCDFGDEWVIGVRIGEHRADREKNCKYHRFISKM
jgi:hypothetical protein